MGARHMIRGGTLVTDNGFDAAERELAWSSQIVAVRAARWQGSFFGHKFEYVAPTSASSIKREAVSTLTLF